VVIDPDPHWHAAERLSKQAAVSDYVDLHALKKKEQKKPEPERSGSGFFALHLAGDVGSQVRFVRTGSYP
jgi:hypothetical protein